MQAAEQLLKFDQLAGISPAPHGAGILEPWSDCSDEDLPKSC